MIIDTSTLEKDERVYLELRALYEGYGYRQFRMRKFEEYSLYLDNKKFLGNEYVLTFNSPDGKLLALKPDVTLSIVKNAKASGKGEEKLYYRESVYRPENREFKEISQMGLERIGNITEEETLEICSLAYKSLATVDEDFVFAVSDMAFIGGLLADCKIEGELKNRVLACLKAKNCHELKSVCESEGVSAQSMDKLLKITGSTTDFGKSLQIAREVAETDETSFAVRGLTALYDAVKGTPVADKIRLDFSILNDIDYYNGIIFQGYVKGMPKVLLSGGRYDSLLEKFNNKVGAMGFALSLTDVAAYYAER